MIKSFQDAIDCLSRSISIKSSHQASLTNKYIVSTYGVNYVNIDNPETWRYYMNINGDYHFSNAEIYVTTVESNSVMLLYNNLLENYPETKEKLLEYDDMFNSLVSTYPVEETLIRGILQPVDYSTVSTLKDGEIISYATSYIEDNESEIMRRLNTYSKNIYTRWFNPLYLDTDPLYLSMFFAFLYSTYPIKIDAMRFENIHTHKAHSYHIGNFFESNLNIDTQYMNSKSKLWLYQNLRAVMTNNGKDDTLSEIMDNVLTENGVGVGNLEVLRSKPIEDSRAMKIPEMNIIKVEDDNTLVFNPMNEYYEKGNIKLPSLLTTEIENDYIHHTAYSTLDELENRIAEDISKNTKINTNSKALHMVGSQERDLLPFPRVNVILDNLFHIYSTSSANYEINFIDSNTNTLYSLTYGTAIRLMGYYLSKISNMDTNDLYIISRAVLSQDADYDIDDLLLDDGSTYQYIRELSIRRPYMADDYLSKKSTTRYVQAVINYFVDEWILKSSMRNQLSVANMELVGRTNHYAEIGIHIGDIKEEIGLIETDDGYDYMTALESVILALSDDVLQVDVNEINKEAIKAYADMVKKTTSYHLQIITDGDNTEKLHVFDVGLGLLESTPIININGYLNGFEPLGGELIDAPISVPEITHTHDNMAYLEPELTDNNGTAVIPNRMLPIRDYRMRDSGISTVYVNHVDDNIGMLEPDLNDSNGSAISPSRLLPTRDYDLSISNYELPMVTQDTDNYYILDANVTDRPGVADTVRRMPLIGQSSKVVDTTMEIHTGVGSTIDKNLDEEN